MATYTSHLNLKLPDYSDTADINDLNDNFKKIDDAIASGGTETDPTVPAWAKQPSKPTYTAGEVGARPDTWMPSASEVGADASGTAAAQVGAHNVSGEAHADLRALIEGLTSRLNALADSDDTTLDQLSEIVAYIKSNKALIDAVTTGKVSVSDIVDNLTTNASGKVLSAAQGVALKAMIDGIVIPTALPNPQPITINGQRYDGSEAVKVTTVEIDDTLTQSGKAADAKAVGDELSALNEAISAEYDFITGLTSFDKEYNLTWINGEYVEKNGEIKPYSSWKRTNYIEIGDADKLVVTNHNPQNNSFNCFFDADKQFISSFGNAENFEVAVPVNAKYFILSLVQSSYPIVKSQNRGIEGIRERLDGVIPDYFDSHLKSKIAEILAHQENADYQSVFFTDYHEANNAKNSVAIIQYLCKKTLIPTVVFGGDIFNSFSNSQTAIEKTVNFRNDFKGSSERFYQIIGNHEYNDPSSNNPEQRLNHKSVYALNSRMNDRYVVSNGKQAFFEDDTVAKIRTYYIGCGYNSSMDADDIKWISDTILNIPDGYAVIVYSHISIEVTKDSTGIYYFNTVNPRINVLTGILNAVKNKNASYRVFVGDYNYLENYSSINADIIGVIGGHCHIDYMGLSNSINLVTTTADAYASECGGLDRTLGTYKEQAFDVVSIDKDNRKVYMTRIGAGEDREFSY